MEKVTDKLETMILMSLDAKHTNCVHGSLRKNPTTREEEIGFDVCEAIAPADMDIKSSFTFDMTDSGRIYSKDPAALLGHPSEIIGDENEIVLLSEQHLTWLGFRIAKKAPRGLAFVGKPACFYELHWRTINAEGRGSYKKSFVGLSSHGKRIPTFFQGRPTSLQDADGTICLAASMIEDAHRANTMLAAVKDATEIKFPVPLGDYKDVFSEREGPMNGARRKAIIHWVSKHLRHSTNGKDHEVKRHTRGVQEFIIDGLRVRLAPNLNSPTTHDA